MYHLYQLYPYQFERLDGNLVDMNGPHDRYGRILKEQEGGTFLIRGLGKSKPPELSGVWPSNRLS